MMKKLSIVLIGLILIFMVGCETVTTSQSTDQSTNSTTSQTTNLTTTRKPYDSRSLVPDSCNHLENIDEWQPVWCDEFDYEGLPDPTKWGYDVGGDGWGNGELQYYTRDDLDNASVSDGTLKITAVKESLYGNSYTSARLVTNQTGSWLYGKLQIKAKMPEGVGTWPAIWMLPTDWTYGGWPASGEIDIMEHVGYNPDEIHGTIHTGAYNHSLNTQIGYSKTVEDAESAFHIYEIEWEPSFIRVYVDGVQYGVFGYNAISNIDIENSDAWPFDQRFHLILNLAIGGSWGGVQGVDPDLLSATMEVDWVRVYQKDYAGLDQEVPSEPTRLSMLRSDQSSIKVYWSKSNDDIMVNEYEIYANADLVGTTSLNAFNIEDLDPSTSYRIDVLAVDFAGNKSNVASLTVSTGSVISILSGRIEAESYDSQSGVMTQPTEDTSGDKNVGYIDTGDYMEYTLFVEEAGHYTITYRVASESAGGEIKLYGKSALPLNISSLPVTGGWQSWQDFTTESFYLTEGVYTFKVYASQGGFNLNYFEFEKVN